MKMLAKCSLYAVDSRTVAESKADTRILIDVREPSLYEKSHIKQSVNLLTSNLLLRRIQRGSLDIKSLLPEHIVATLTKDIYCENIVIYDENTKSETQTRRLTVIGSALKKAFPRKSVFCLNGFDEFCENYPSCCEFDYPVDCPNPFQIYVNNGEFKDPTDKNVFSPEEDVCPVSILPFLYLGNAHHSSQKELLDKLGVTAILNVSRTCPVLFQDTYEYKTIPIDDSNSENIRSHFDEAINFIDNIKSKNGTVLVHCRAGISRSATICIAYLMRKYAYTLDQAYEYTKKKRSAISPNFNFLGQLLTFEREVSGKTIYESKTPSPLSLSSLKLPLSIETIKTPLHQPTQLFTYSPKTCLSFFNVTGSGNMSPFHTVLTPS